MDLDVRPLASESWPAFADWWASDGTSTSRWCWCVYFRFRGRDWTNSKAADNRTALQALTEGDPAPGLVAYRDGRPIGWVSLAPREDYERLAYSKVLAPIDETPVWSIVCFVVSRMARGQGVAAALLDAAVDYARGHGATTLEAYPVDTNGGRVPADEAYRGTLTMFERAGFTVVERRQWNATTPVRPIVRLTLDHDR